MLTGNKLVSLASKYNLVVIAAVIFAVSTIINPSFASGFNLLAILLDTAIFGFLVLGESLVVISGGIDLSVGNMASMSSVIIAWSMRGMYGLVPDWITLPVCLLFALVFCGFIGFLSGLSIGYLNVPPLIATLGAMWVVQGIGYYFLSGVPTPFPIAAFRSIFAGDISFIPFSALYLLLIVVLANRLVKSMRYGRWVYAVGGSEYAARISGIDTRKTKVGVYMTSAILAGIGGVFVGAYSGVGNPRACNGYELYAIAAVVMGGIALTGGEGKIWNAILATFILRILNKFIIFSRLSGYIEGMVVGAILVGTLLVSTGRRRSRRKTVTTAADSVKTT
ncbi:MAG: ABC transporter permease [Spirochaetaceae bacterium]|nr:MAG: ABC transporter permease [Spirochaetaceae bacterium]